MAVVWGSWSSTSANRARLGLDISVSGTRITVQYWVEVQYSVFYNGLRLARSGGISGGVDYNLQTSGGTHRIITSSMTGTRGSSYSFSASTSITTSSGTIRPTISRSATIPAGVPSAPARPSVSSVTATAATASLASAPNGNGATVTQYEWQVGTSSAFPNVWDSGTTTARSWRTTGRSINQTYYVRVRARNSAGWSSWSAAREFKTKVGAPSAPTGISVTRASDTQQTVTWTRNATTDRPYSSQRVLRRDNISTGLKVVGNVSGSATSFADSTTQANRRYDYFVEAVNASGTARSSSFASIVTSPSAPTGITVRKVGTAITVSWTPTATYLGVTGYTIQDNPDGTGWTTVATLGNVTTWTHTTADPAKTHRYRVAARTTTPALTGPYSAASTTVQLQAPPQSPTLRSPVSTTLDFTEPVTFNWSHNPVDGTDQTQAEVQYRKTGTTTWTTIDHTGATQTLTTSSLTSGTWEWRARTRGDHPNWSPYSTTATVSLAEQPAVTFLTPADLHNTSTFEITLAAYTSDNTGSIARVQIQLLDENATTLEDRDITGTWANPSHWTTTLNTPAQNNTAYTIRARVRSSLGLWSEWSEVTVDVVYALPPKPVISAEWDEGQSGVVLTIENPLEATYEWEGEPHASTSVKKVGGQVVARNYIVNGDFENGVTEWSGNNATIVTTTSHTTQMWGGFGGHLLEASLNTSSQHPHVYQDIDLSHFGGGYFGASAYVAARPGVQVRLHFIIYRPSGPEYANTGFTDANYYDGHWIHRAFPLPSDATSLRVHIQANNEALASGRHIWADKIAVSLADSEQAALDQVAEYFDGDMLPQVAADTNDIYRRTEDGPWELVLQDVPLNATLIDYTAPLGVDLEYVAQAKSGLPSIAVSDPVTITVNTTAAVLSGGESFGISIPLTYNPEVEWSTGLAERRLHYFAGRNHPVETSGQALSRELSYSGLLTTDEGHLTTLEQLANLPGPHLWRSPDGQVIYASMSRPNIRRLTGGAGHEISFQLTEVDQYVRIIDDISAQG